MRKSFYSPLSIVAILIMVTTLLPTLAQAKPTIQVQAPLQPSETDRGQVTEVLKTAPLMFIENAGQMDPKARFEVVGANGALFLTEEALWYGIVEKSKDQSSFDPAQGLEIKDRIAKSQDRKAVNLKESFVGANPHPHLEPFNRLETQVSYFKGNDPDKWRSDVPVWGGVRYVDLYPRIDLEITGENGHLAQWIVAKPGADLSTVAMQVEGADALQLEGGAVGLRTALGNFSLPLLEVESENGSLMITPTGEPVVKGNVIADPFTTPTETSAVQTLVGTSPLIYSTFLGGTGDDNVISMAVDSSGAAYLAGQTSSPDFPFVSGYTNYNHGGLWDMFVAKLNPAGTGLIYATYLGGDGLDIAQAIAVDPSGAAYVAGLTASTDFPTPRGMYDRYLNGGWDAVLARLGPSGSTLSYATYLGGTDSDWANALALGPANTVYLTGYTASSDFPTTPTAYDRSHSNGDAFLVKFDLNTNKQLTYSTFLSGSNEEEGRAIALDSSGFAYVAGYTASSDFPTTPSAFDPTFNGGGNDAFLVKVNPAGKVDPFVKTRKGPFLS